MAGFVKRIRLNKSYLADSDYVSSLMITRLLSDIEDLELPSPVTYFVGENGSGKSTLLEAIAVQAGFNPEGGTRNFSFSTHETHSGCCANHALISCALTRLNFLFCLISSVEKSGVRPNI